MRVIKRNIGIEELKSRIPGLFPYLEFDEYGNLVKHKATDSVDGCYGKIIPDFNGKTYRTLITDYYNGKNVDKIGDYDFEEVIGKFEVNLDDYSESQTLVPKYIYAAEAKELLDKMIKLKKACDAASMSPIFCCDCKEYKERGGDKMVEFLTKITNDAKEIAENVFDLFDDDANMSINVNLCGAVEDFGYYTTVDVSKTQFIGDSFSADIYCNDETLYSKSSKDEVDAPLELPNNDNTPGGNGEQLWFNEDDGEMVWRAKRMADFSTWRVSKIARESKLNGATDSKLKSFRRYTTYTNDMGVAELPQSGYDWLYFYRNGFVTNYETVNDDFGNIAFLDNGTVPIESGGFVTNLDAYGSVIDTIERDKDERSITFTYYINAHLKAKKSAERTDDDGNKLYFYEYPFKYESGGVKQTETYYYAEGGDIDELSDSDFEKLTSLYTKDGNGKLEADFAETTNKKYEFYTMDSVGFYKKTIFDKTTNIEYGYSSFEYVKPNTDVISDECYTLFKEDYLNGIHYAPTVSSSVNIQRGNNAAFERHIRLGEVKTLEDMENYQNGSFFNIQETI